MLIFITITNPLMIESGDGAGCLKQLIYRALF